METPSHTSAFCGEKEPLVGWGGPVVAQQRKKGIWEGLGKREGAPKRPLGPSRPHSWRGFQEKTTIILFILPLPGRHEEL